MNINNITYLDLSNSHNPGIRNYQNIATKLLKYLLLYFLLVFVCFSLCRKY